MIIIFSARKTDADMPTSGAACARPDFLSLKVTTAAGECDGARLGCDCRGCEERTIQAGLLFVKRPSTLEGGGLSMPCYRRRRRLTPKQICQRGFSINNPRRVRLTSEGVSILLNQKAADQARLTLKSSPLQSLYIIMYRTYHHRVHHRHS